MYTIRKVKTNKDIGCSFSLIRLVSRFYTGIKATQVEAIIIIYNTLQDRYKKESKKFYKEAIKFQKNGTLRLY